MQYLTSLLLQKPRTWTLRQLEVLNFTVHKTAAAKVMRVHLPNDGDPGKSTLKISFYLISVF
jgi:hypothetical protein